MTDAESQNVALTGDLRATEEVSISTRGGSLGATLKKGIRDHLVLAGNRLAGGVVEFAAGQSLVLLSGGATEGARAFQVRRITPNRYEIELETDETDDDEVDAMTAAFLALKAAQFERGELRLSPPMTADKWRQRFDRALAATEAQEG
jgi:hypothetical protein